MGYMTVVKQAMYGTYVISHKIPSPVQPQEGAEKRIITIEGVKVCANYW